MSQPPRDALPGTARAQWVEIRVHGLLDPRWGAWFDPLDVVPQADGTTVLRGAVVDQAALFGTLQSLRDLALPLVSVALSEPPGSGPPAVAGTPDPSTQSNNPRSQP